MHMLEAMLAWQAIAPDPAFEAAARTSLDLCKQRFLIDGAIREYFTEDWSADPATGYVIEPGHLEEWAWLLKQSGDDSDLATALHRRAAAQGYRDRFAIREIGPAGEVLDGGRRLWAQTEAIRTGLSFGDTCVSALIAAVFHTHLATAVPGLWVDSYDADCRSHDEAAPASSLYHLMTAFSELLRSDA